MEKEEEKKALRAEIAMLTRLINDPTTATTGGLPLGHYNYNPPIPVYRHSSVQHSFPSNYKHSSQYYRNTYASGYRPHPYHVSKSKYTYTAAAAKTGLKSTNSTATAVTESAKAVAPQVVSLSSLVRRDLLPARSIGAPTVPRNAFVQASSLTAPAVPRLNTSPKLSTLSNGWVTKSRYKVDRRVKLKSPNDTTKKPETLIAGRRGHTPLSPIAKYSTFPNKKSVSPKTSLIKSPLRKRVDATSPANNVVNIRGAKYVTDNSGKSLKRIRSNSTSTFSQASPSPTKRVANRVLQRSVEMGRRRKRNDTCLFYDRFRYCKRHVMGICPFVHKIDKASSRRKSSLSIADLLTLSKPCKFYNLGRCSRDDCPYLHVKSKARSERRRRALLSKHTPSSSREDGHKDSMSNPEPKPKKPVSRYYHVAPDPATATPSSSKADQTQEDSEGESDSESCDSDSESDTSEGSYESEYEEIEVESDDSVQEIPVSPKNNKCELLNGKGVSEILPLKVEKVNEEVETVSVVGPPSSPPSAHELRRQRLMSKVANLKRRYARPEPDPADAAATNPKPISTAPTYLSF